MLTQSQGTAAGHLANTWGVLRAVRLSLGMFYMETKIIEQYKFFYTFVYVTQLTV